MTVSVEEIREVLLAKIEVNIEDCLKKLAQYQQEDECRYLRPHVHFYNQKYLSYQRTRQTRYWSYRQKRIQHELLTMELSFFINNLVPFKYEAKKGKTVNMIILNGDQNMVLQDHQNSNTNLKN